MGSLFEAGALLATRRHALEQPPGPQNKDTGAPGGRLIPEEVRVPAGAGGTAGGAAAGNGQGGGSQPQLPPASCRRVCGFGLLGTTSDIYFETQKNLFIK